MELNIYTSRRAALKLVALSAPFAAVAIWALVNPRDSENPVMLVLVMALFGLAMAVGLFKLFDRRVQLRFTEEGLWDRGLGQGLIRWEQIRLTYPVAVNRQKFISLQLSDDFVWQKRPYALARMLNRGVGAEDANISVSWLAIDVGELLFMLTRMRNAPPERRADVLRELILRRG